MTPLTDMELGLIGDMTEDESSIPSYRMNSTRMPNRYVGNLGNA